MSQLQTPSETIYHTNRLSLRNWIDSDTEPFIALNQNSKAMEYYPDIYTPEETITQIKKFNQHHLEYGYTMFACELKATQQFIGFVGLLFRDFDLPFSPCVEIGWRLDPEYWGQGLAVEAANKCLEIGFNKFHLKEIISFTAKLNRRSERVMQKLGMRYNIKDDFAHPKLAKDHTLSPHVLYRINHEDWFRTCL